jgi:hypothetical protein
LLLTEFLLSRRVRAGHNPILPGPNHTGLVHVHLLAAVEIAGAAILATAGSAGIDEPTKRGLG